MEKWYKDGLRFECTGCGNCCTGGPGFVWVNKQEQSDLAAAMGIDCVEEFNRLYVRQIGVRYSLKELPNYDCVLFDGESRKCSVYDARPRQCRSWPFWDSNVRAERDWHRTCRVCPGAGEGTLYQIEQIEAQRRLIRI